VESSSLRFSKEKEQKITNLYTRVLPVGARILDLMVSVDSHVADGLQPVSVAGLGMNREELNANPRRNECLAHDLNPDPGLPFADASFNAAVCSVEYLTDPLAEFAEVWRALKPGEVFINSFSSRWFPPKAINLWIDLHEFERMGLVGGVLSAHRGFRDPGQLVPAGAATSARGQVRCPARLVGSALWGLVAQGAPLAMSRGHAHEWYRPLGLHAAGRRPPR
jgi:SAM-dependent methyltransferase